MTNDVLIRTVIQRWKREPWTMVREAFRVEPDAWQDEGLHALTTSHRLAFKACKGPGKTAILAWAILWFLLTRDYCRIGATSITEANIDANLWPELYKWMSRSPVFMELFAWTKSAVVNKREPQNWWAQKRTWPKHGDSQQQSDALAGLHADHVMFVGDEVGGYPQSVMATAEAVLANEEAEAFLLIAGNPTHTTGPLYRACTTDRALWHVTTITGDPDSPLRSPRISMEWARQQIQQYGRENPWVMVNVLGEFPPASINALLGVEEVERAMRLKLDPSEYEWAQKRLGLDVARFGDDRTVLYPRQGRMTWQPVIMRNANTAAIAARVAHNITRWQAELTLIDDTGHWGHGVIDQLQTANFPGIIGLQYHAPSALPHYKNVRSHNWLKMADWVRAGGRLPFSPDLIRELTEITYTFLGGQFVLEPKDLVKQRLGWSPDEADALSNTFHLPDMPGGMAAQLPGQRGVLRDKTPFALVDERPQGAMRDRAPFAE